MADIVERLHAAAKQIREMGASSFEASDLDRAATLIRSQQERIAKLEARTCREAAALLRSLAKEEANADGR